jgi:hypothetical protein
MLSTLCAYFFIAVSCVTMMHATPLSRFSSIYMRAEHSKQIAESREQRAESKRAESREQRAESREQRRVVSTW